MRLSRALGPEFRHVCARCGADETYHVDDVTASAERTKRWGLLAAAVIAGAVTAALWRLGWVSGLSLLLFGGIYFAVQQGADKQAMAFNSYTLGRRARAAG